MKVKPTIYKIDGEVVSKAEFKRRSKAAKTGTASRITRAYERGLISRSAGCHSSQVEQKNKFLESRGVKGARFLKDGNVRFESRAARNDFCRARGLVDFDGGYGDVT